MYAYVWFGFKVYKFLARCTTAYGGVNHGVTGIYIYGLLQWKYSHSYG